MSGSLRLDESVFGIQPNVPVLHQVVTAQLAAARAGTQSTKTRAEVSGGGRKPFKQKGTGRARQGSERAPHFTGGGVALGPKPRSYRQRTPRKMIQLALRSALSDRAADGKVVVVDAWPWDDPEHQGGPRRARRARARRQGAGGAGPDRRGGVQVLPQPARRPADAGGELNAYDILCNDWIVFTRETLPGETTSRPDGAVAEAPPSQPRRDAPRGPEDRRGRARR